MTDISRLTVQPLAPQNERTTPNCQRLSGDNPHRAMTVMAETVQPSVLLNGRSEAFDLFFRVIPDCMTYLLLFNVD